MIGSGLLFFLATAYASAQDNVGVGTTTPDPSAALDITANNKGVLVPRLTTVQRLAIATPANGLMVYDVNEGCFFYYIAPAATWRNLCEGAINCWDLNGNHINDPNEDINSDGLFNGQDCTGAQGATGPAGPAGPQGIQ